MTGVQTCALPISFDNDSGIWKDDYDRFLEQRAQLMMSEIFELAGDGNEVPEGEDTTEQIRNTESNLRDLIHDRLSEKADGSYRGILPGDLTTSIDDKDGMEDRELLSHISMNGCARVINLHWDMFNDVFPSQEDLDHHMSNLQEFDSEAQEGDVDSYTELDAGLSMQWISSCIKNK